MIGILASLKCLFTKLRRTYRQAPSEDGSLEELNQQKEWLLEAFEGTPPGTDPDPHPIYEDSTDVILLRPHEPAVVAMPLDAQVNRQSR